MLIGGFFRTACKASIRFPVQRWLRHIFFKIITEQFSNPVKRLSFISWKTEGGHDAINSVYMFSVFYWIRHKNVKLCFCRLRHSSARHTQIKRHDSDEHAKDEKGPKGIKMSASLRKGPVLSWGRHLRNVIQASPGTNWPTWVTSYPHRQVEMRHSPIRLFEASQNTHIYRGVPLNVGAR